MKYNVKEFLEHYDNKTFELTDQDCEDLVFASYFSSEEYKAGLVTFVDEVEGDSSRWTQTIKTIIKIQDRLFAIEWDKGLTEIQEHEFYADNVIEVEKKVKTIQVVTYEDKKVI